MMNTTLKSMETNMRTSAMNRIIQFTALMSVVAFIAIAEARAPHSPRGAAKIAQSEQFNGETALMHINNMSLGWHNIGLFPVIVH